MSPRKMPVPKGADQAFLYMSIKDVQESTQLRRIADRKIELVRASIVKRVGNALWNRYRTYHKKVETPPTFLEWLLLQRSMEKTYLHHSLHTRLYWVYRVIQASRRPELLLFNEKEFQPGNWYRLGLQADINRHRSTEDFIVHVLPSATTERLIIGPVPTFVFARGKLPVVESNDNAVD